MLGSLQSEVESIKADAEQRLELMAEEHAREMELVACQSEQMNTEKLNLSTVGPVLLFSDLTCIINGLLYSLHVNPFSPQVL